MRDIDKPDKDPDASSDEDFDIKQAEKVLYLSDETSIDEDDWVVLIFLGVDYML